MVSQKEAYALKRMYRVIKEQGVIDRTSFQKLCGNMSISRYNKLKPYLEEEYEGRIRYESQRKIWIDLNPDTKDKQELVQKMLESYHL